MKERSTLYVKMYGAPGAGKSTGAAWLFSQLKMREINSEYVQEFAKDMVWENNQFLFDDPDNQLIIFSSQFYRLNRLRGKVDVVVTDSPLLLSEAYSRRSPILNCEEYRALVEKLDAKFPGLNFFVTRNKRFEPGGRNESEEESDALAKDIESILERSGEPFWTISGDLKGYSEALRKILERIYLQ